MKVLLFFIGGCLLFVLSWPLALLALMLALVLAPFVGLLALPLVLLGVAVGAVFALLTAVLYLPARLLGHRPG